MGSIHKFLTRKHLFLDYLRLYIYIYICIHTYAIKTAVSVFCSYARHTETFKLSFHSRFLPLASLNALNFSNKRKEKTSFLPSKQVVLKVWSLGNPLAVQWLGLGALTARGPGSIPGWGRRPKKKKKKVWFSDHKHQHPPTLLRNADSQAALRLHSY